MINPGRPGNATEQEQTDRNRNRTQAMNVDREDELRIQAPPGAARASENRHLLDRAGLTPEAQERKHEEKTPTLRKKKFFAQRPHGNLLKREMLES